MMKKHIVLRASLFLIVLLLVTTCIISGTYAKYVSTDIVTSTANIAKWSFKVEDTDISKNTTFSFKLFDTVSYSDTKNLTPHMINNDLIAPGTEGFFELDLNNTSDVPADCVLTLNYVFNDLPAGVSSIPLEFSFDGTNYSATPEAATVSAIPSGTTKKVNVCWRWPATGHSAIDKLLQTTSAGVTVTLTVVASQTSQ